MSDTPKFEVIDRRKFKAEEEQASQQSEQAAERKPEPALPHGGPQLVVNEHSAAAQAAAAQAGDAVAAELESEAGVEGAPALPPTPTAQESREQAAAYEAAAQRLEELIRAQNPAVGAQPPIAFEHLVQQFYVSAMIQMGAGAQEGQRPRVDILGARTTIDLLGVLAEKTRGNLSPAEDRALQTVLFEARMAFMELTSMINLQAMQPPQPPPPGKR